MILETQTKKKLQNKFDVDDYWMNDGDFQVSFHEK